MLSAVGVATNLEGIGLEDVGVATDKGKVIVDDFYIEKFRKNRYLSIGEIQKDLDRWVQEYNSSPNLTNFCYGKSPLQVMEDSKQFWRRLAVFYGST